MDYRKTHGRRNWKYQQNKRHIERDLRLARNNCYPCNMWVTWEWNEEKQHSIPVGNYIKRPRNSNMKTFYKKYTNRIIRHSKSVPSGCLYQKYFDMWWALY